MAMNRTFTYPASWHMEGTELVVQWVSLELQDGRVVGIESVPANPDDVPNMLGSNVAPAEEPRPIRFREFL